MTTSIATVDTPCGAYKEMASKWELIDALLGGTLAMRAGGEKWLPKEPKEDPQAYLNRLARSVLFNAYADTVDNIVSKPFSRPVTIQGELPESLQDIADDVNREGQNLSQFAREVFEEAVNRGLTHILVDYPQTRKEDGSTPSLAEERTGKIRPKFIHIKPSQLIGWRTEPGPDGSPRLAEIRIKETHIEPDGRYGEKTVDFVRLYTTTIWELHRKQDGDKGYVLEKSGTHSFQGIPLVTVYLTRSGFLVAEPPLDDLAWMNLAHYQSYSDQRNILRFARTGLIFAKGLSEEDTEKNILVGPNAVFKTTNPEADMKYVEHSGAAIGAGRQDIKDIEERMEVLGLQPFMRKTAGQTATGQSIDEVSSNSSVQSWIRAVENGLVAAFQMAAEWVGAELPEDFKADIYNDFGLSMRAQGDVDNLIKTRQAGELSRVTFLREIKRRGVISENIDVDEEIAKIEEEGPALSLIGIGAGTGDGGGE